MQTKLDDIPEARWAKRILLAFALVGLLHIPAFYWLVFEAVRAPETNLAPACPGGGK